MTVQGVQGKEDQDWSRHCQESVSPHTTPHSEGGACTRVHFISTRMLNFRMVRLQGWPCSAPFPPMKLKPRLAWVGEANEVYSVPSQVQNPSPCSHQGEGVLQIWALQFPDVRI